MSPRAKKKPEEETKSPHELAADIRKLMEALGVQSGRAEVYRKLPGKRPVYLDAFGIAEIASDPHARIKADFGGGDYQITLRDENGDYLKGGSYQVSIAGLPAKPPDRFEELEKRWEERLEKAGGASSPELVSFMFQTMREQIREMRNPPPQAAQANPLELAVSLMDTVQRANEPLLRALMERREEPKSRTEELRELLQMAVLLSKLGGEKATGMDAVVEKLAAPLGRFFDSAAGGGGGGPLLPPGAPPMATPSAPAPANGRPAWFSLLERAIPQLLAWARADKDPELRADFVIDELPDAMLPPIHEQLRRGADFTQEFLTHVPESQQFGPWFAAFFARVLEILEAGWEPAEGSADAGAQPERTIELRRPEVDTEGAA